MKPPDPYNEDYPVARRAGVEEFVHGLRGPVPISVGLLLSVVAIGVAAVALRRRPRMRRRWIQLGFAALVAVLGVGLVVTGARFSPPAEARPIFCVVGERIDCNTEHVETSHTVADGAPYGSPALYLPDGHLTLERGTPVFVHLRLEQEVREAARRCLARIDSLGIEAAFDGDGEALLALTPDDHRAAELRMGGVGCPLVPRLPLRVLERASYLEWAQRTHRIELSELNPPKPPWRGESVFRRRCERCHSLDGTVAAGPTILDLYGTVVTLADGTQHVVDTTYLRQVLTATRRSWDVRFPLPCAASHRIEFNMRERDVERLVAFIYSRSALAIPRDEW